MIHRPERERERERAVQSPVSCSLGLEASGGSAHCEQLTDNRAISYAISGDRKEEGDRCIDVSSGHLSVLPGDTLLLIPDKVQRDQVFARRPRSYGVFGQPGGVAGGGGLL